ncbi:MAG: transglycosylase SLT domain-containing protein [Pseudomonadales bacterium]|nr:transglycosylase SLT domain-containing protein [Pseudomonadales bacterium]
MPRTNLLVACACFLLCATGSAASPRHAENACLLLKEKRGWYKHVVAAEEKWKIDAATILSVIYQESTFRARAKPKRKRFLFIPVGQKQTAYGYAQVKDKTWDDYRKRTNQPHAKRASFRYATDFVGYYLDWISRNSSIPRKESKWLYVAYHEGLGGYSRGTWRSKDWLLESARKVEDRAERYMLQLLSCRVGPAQKYKRLRKRGR